MKFIPKLCLLVLALVAGGNSARAANAPPRLWEVTGKSEEGIAGKFYILPVTHNGLDVEYDEYFYKVVVPIALKADAFFHEDATLVPKEVPACADPLADTRENREILRQAYIDVERAAYDLRTPIPREKWMSEQDWREVQEIEHMLAHGPISKLTEYGLVVAMGTLLFNKQLHHPELFPKVDYSVRPDIADFIADQRWKNGKKKNESIDKSTDFYDIYCAIGPQKRGQYLRQKIAESDPAVFKPMSREKREYYSQALVESVQKGYLTDPFDDHPNDDYSRHAVCDRNDKWLIKMRQGMSDGIRFYALGGAHVLQPGPSNPNRCDGLLTRLRHAGYIVTLLR